MQRTVVIHQPDFAPYLGFFHRFLESDLYIVLDHVQFVTGTSRSWTHRDKVKTPTGEKWLTLGVEKAHLGTPINEVELADGSDWVDGNLALLRNLYRKAPGFAEVMPLVEDLYADPPLLLRDFNVRWLKRLAELLEVAIPFVLSSTLDPKGHKNELLVDLLTKVGATRYLSGSGARDYMEPAIFQQAEIEVVWQQFVHPVYPQQFGPFRPYLSILDALFNCGVAETRTMLRNCK